MHEHEHTTKPVFLTPASVAAEHNVNVTTVGRWIRSGQLPTVGKLAGRTGAYLLDPDDVEAFLARRNGTEAIA